MNNGVSGTLRPEKIRFLPLGLLPLGILKDPPNLGDAQNLHHEKGSFFHREALSKPDKCTVRV
jgi:hypothetical protein